MKIYFLILIIGLLYSCKEKDDSAQPNEYAAKFVRELNTADTFLYDYPKYKLLRLDSFMRKYQLEKEKNLQIQSLRNGFDSIQIRIWYGCGMLGDRLITLTNQNNKWVAEISNINLEYVKTIPGLDSISREISYKTPKSGWVKFIKELFDLKILSLPDENNILGFTPRYGTDGCGFSVEIATKNAYRYYGFANPGSFEGEKFYVDDGAIWQERNIVYIIRLLSKEFGISEWPSWSKILPYQDFRDTIRN